MTALLAAFLLTAFLYSMVGFGGGSTYSALLVLSATDFQLLPALTLTCNIIVVAGGTWHFSRVEKVASARLLPFVCLSVPMALLGGLLPVSERLFAGMLGMTLLLTSFAMMVRMGGDQSSAMQRTRRQLWLTGLPIGAAIGLLSGIVGIGGGVFLAPLLHLLRWGTAQAIAAACCVFIMVNSMAGLTGQLIKLGDLQRLTDLREYLWLFPAVFIGGQLGSRIGSRRLPGRVIRLLTAVLVAYVAVRLLYRWKAIA